ncbi:MAG: response regulator [Kofleriaceae bacterium]|nr:response regulator [Kofleriaceae bacterium]MBP9171951.1 response regulator [Kofleriaceae bacterium]MBP9859326.1 response regulator [Kofleriaceae bacterium]
MKPVHPTLVRQLRRAFGLRANEVDGFLADLAAAPDQPLAAGLTRLIDTLGDAYAQHDRDQVLRQRALELSSAELTTANQRLLADRASVAEAIHNLRDSARALTGRDADLAAAPGDDLVALSESLRDLARRNHEMQAQLASSEVKIRSLIANVPGCVFRLRLRPTVEVDFVSDGIAELSGYPIAAWRQAPQELGRAIGGPHLFLRAEELAATGGEAYEVEYPLTMADGRRRWVIERGRVCCELDGQLWWTALVIDNDVARRARDELARARQGLVLAKDEAERANRAKTEFLANISHEIRTPLNGILGMLDLALGDDDSVEHREHLGLARSSAGVLLELINDVLDLSKIEAGKLELDEVPFAPRSLIRETLRPLALRAAERGLEFTVEFAPGVGDGLVGDASKLRQVLTNLASNAIKFTAQGSVAVRVAPAVVGVDEPGLKIEVRDTGIGIAPSRHAAIFEPFAQASSSTPRQYGGTGLGLTIVRRLVQLLGGTITLVSEPGRGSTFAFTVAARPVEAAPASEHAGVAIGRRLMILDDDPASVGWLAAALRRRGADVATSLAELGEAARGGPMVDAVLVRGDSPRALEVAAEVARRQPAAKLVLLSALDRRIDRARARAVRPRACLVKPFDEAEALEAIAEALQPSRPTPVSDAATPSRGLRVLVAEDNVVNQKLIARFLERDQHAYHLVGDGAAAVDAFKTERYDVVLLDLQMPVLDGVEAARAMRAHERFGQLVPTPIIALTGNALSEARDACLAAGIDAFMTKPIALDRLRRELVRYAARGAERSPMHAPRP